MPQRPLSGFLSKIHSPALVWPEDKSRQGRGSYCVRQASGNGQMDRRLCYKCFTFRKRWQIASILTRLPLRPLIPFHCYVFVERKLANVRYINLRCVTNVSCSRLVLLMTARISPYISKWQGFNGGSVFCMDSLKAYVASSLVFHPFCFCWRPLELRWYRFKTYRLSNYNLRRTTL